MNKKFIVKFFDGNCQHDVTFIKDTENINYIRYNFNVENNDIVMYSSYFLENINPLAKINIALMMESRDIEEYYYNYIENNNNLFDIVLTFDKKLLDRGENFKLNLFGTSWLHVDYRNIWPKYKLCSFILSNKNTTHGHKLRHSILNRIITNNISNIDIYGNNFIKLPFSEIANPKDISNKKINALNDYCFSIVIENTKKDYYFTEKLIDCFLSGTIPIYYGCPSISTFFNANGILSFDNENECLDIINNLSYEKYNTMLEYIKDNYERAKQYVDFKINEDHILEIIKQKYII